MKENSYVKYAKNILLNLIGSSLLALGVYAFIEPFGLIVGGSTGISLILHRLTGINLSVFAMAINLIVLPIGLIFRERDMVLGSVLSSFFYPCALAVFEHFPAITGIADNIVLATICGGVVCGSGIGIVMRSGASTGGMDIPALLISKFLHLPVNKTMNALDTVIMLGQLPFSPVTNIIYGLIYTYIMTNALGHVLIFGEDRMKVTVISEHYEEVCDHLIANDFGVTMLYAESGYTKTPIKKVESIMRSHQYRKAIRIIEEADPESFITISKIKDVKGRGFTMERNYIDL